ncbi:MAG: adenylate kinase [Clostridiales Family XIII bacterium]|jgi:adenylate kinase|nr:adenylate kinase [Clostridiales Family XIII bacterium]
MSTNVIILGAPGSGKGTQAAKLTHYLGISAISTGEILRANISDGTELGKRAKEYMDKGELVPDELVTEIAVERLGRSDCTKGFLLDGFPRTLAQAEALDAYLSGNGKKIDKVLLINVTEDMVVRRLSGRRVCRSCGASYHVATMPPAKEGVCDLCSGELIQRSDDNEETVRNRIRVYEQQTLPLIEYYRGKGLLASMDGEAGLEEIFAEIVELLT